jgi:RNA polymerase sigma factor (sigma-70 family)
MKRAHASDTDLVLRARGGDRDAFATLIERYRNAVYGLAYHLIGDFETARDIAQDVFIRAFGRLGDLREPAKFAPWLRQMTANECRQWQRSEQRRRMMAVSHAFPKTRSLSPNEIATRLAVRQALTCLSEDSRLAIVLYYVHDCSLRDIADFLDAPTTAVKSRLRDARARLRKEMLSMLEETAKTEALPATFTDDVVQRLLRAAYDGDAETIRTMLAQDERLAFVRGELPSFRPGPVAPAVAAAGTDQREVVNLLRQRGAIDRLTGDERNEMLGAAAFHQNRELANALVAVGTTLTIHDACLLGDAEAVRAFLAKDPNLVHARGIQGETPLHDAGTVQIARILLEAGADIDVHDTSYDNTPIEFMCQPNRRWRDVVDYLISRGAQVRFHLACWLNDAARVHAYLDADPACLHQRNHGGRPEGRKLPITLAATAGAVAVLGVLLDHGADMNTRDEKRGGATPLHVAALWGYAASVALLLDRGADRTIQADGHSGEPLHGATPLEWAMFGAKEEWGKASNPLDGAGNHAEVIALLTETN